MKMVQGQVSTEFLILTGLLLLLLTAVVYVSFQMQSSHILASELLSVRVAAKSILAHSQQVCLSSNSSYAVIDVALPARMYAFRIENDSLFFTLASNTGLSFTYGFLQPVSGSLYVNETALSARRGVALNFSKNDTLCQVRSVS